MRICTPSYANTRPSSHPAMVSPATSLANGQTKAIKRPCLRSRGISLNETAMGRVSGLVILHPQNTVGFNTLTLHMQVCECLSMSCVLAIHFLTMGPFSIKRYITQLFWRLGQQNPKPRPQTVGNRSDQTATGRNNIQTTLERGQSPDNPINLDEPSLFVSPSPAFSPIIAPRFVRHPQT